VRRPSHRAVDGTAAITGSTVDRFGAFDAQSDARVVLLAQVADIGDVVSKIRNWSGPKMITRRSRTGTEGGGIWALTWRRANCLRGGADAPPIGILPRNRRKARIVMAGGDRDGSFERLSLLYQENSRVAAVFWEWQHKTLTIFTAGITALLAIEVWIYNNDFGRYMAIPPGAAALLSWLCMRFTERNRTILNRTYEIGKQLEAEIAVGLERPPELIYTWLGSHPGTYRRILPKMFKVAVVVFLAVAVAAVIHPPSKAVHLTSSETRFSVAHAPKAFRLHSDLP
jgi:hypothetical protein